MFVTYLLRELRRRMRQAITTVADQKSISATVGALVLNDVKLWGRSRCRGAAVKAA